MKPQEAVEIMRQRIKETPALEAELRAAWGRACDTMQIKLTAHRPKLKSFEAHHLLETARCRFMVSVATGAPLAVAEANAVSTVDSL